MLYLYWTANYPMLLNRVCKYRGFCTGLYDKSGKLEGAGNRLEKGGGVPLGKRGLKTTAMGNVGRAWNEI